MSVLSLDDWEEIKVAREQERLTLKTTSMVEIGRRTPGPTLAEIKLACNESLGTFETREESGRQVLVAHPFSDTEAPDFSIWLRDKGNKIGLESLRPISCLSFTAEVQRDFLVPYIQDIKRCWNS